VPARAASKPTTVPKYYPFNGGLDVVTPALSVDPGFALTMVNYEPWFNGGYRRVDGFERFDGHAKPSAAVAYGAVISTLTGLTTGTGASGAGTGSVSGATGNFVEGILVSGTSWVAITNVTGTFGTLDKILQGTNTSTGVIGNVPSVGYGPSGTSTTGFLYTSDFLANAQGFYRAQINAVPGTGNVLGAWQNGTNIYAWRGTGTSGATNMYLSSAAGWTKTGVTLVNTLYYTGLGTQGLPANGSVITGNSSGVTGTLYQGISHTVSAGYLALTGLSGTFSASEALKAGGTSFGTSVGTSLQFSWPTGGFYRFRNQNFFASSSTYNTYGVNGVGPAFQIDQNNVVMPILMPNVAMSGQPAANNPFLVETSVNFLTLAFPGGNFQQSVQGVPYQFNGFLGAAQYGVGAEITGLLGMVGPTLVIPTAKNTQGLAGNSVSNYVQSVLAEKAGAIKYGSVLLDTVYSINNLGITSLSRTQSYGNFVGATISQLVQPIVAALRPSFTDATIVRSSNQARFYFSDGSVLIIYVPGLGQQNKAWSAIESGVTAQFGYASYPNPVFNICNSEDNLNNEVSYFGSTNGDGFVYQDRSGTSWDGAVVTSYTRLAFNNVGSPAMRKYFRRADLEINSPAQIFLKFAFDLSYSNLESSSAVANLTANNIPVSQVFGGGGYWDNVNWNQFEWDGQVISTARANLGGTGENISFLIFHQAIVDTPFILQGLVLYFDPRRLQR
jgi:hypothetical protein